MGRLAMGLVGALIVAAITVSLGQSQPPAEPSERKLEPQPAGDVQTPRELQRDDDRRTPQPGQRPDNRDPDSRSLREGRTSRDERGPGGRGPFGPGPGGFPPNFFNRGGGPTERIPPEKLDFRDGVARVPDYETYHKLAYRGQQVLIDTFLADLEFVKFTLNEASQKDRQLYFINTKTHRAHMMFGNAVGLPRTRGGDQMKGVLVFRPMLKSPSGEAGLFTFEFEPFDSYSFEMVKTAYDALTSKMPILKGHLGYYPRGDRALDRYEEESEKYATANLRVYLDVDLYSSDVGYLPLNPGTAYGRLRLMSIDERPSPREIVLYNTLPNEMPRVAGIITAVRQTPLSHVNLRAVQDRVPNAFITKASEDKLIKPLIGKLVAYSVTADGYTIREATAEEAESHFTHLRPVKKQTPKRDLANTKIRSLDEVSFKDASSVGVKAANLAVMRTFEFPAGTIPAGSVVPFSFYDEFMKHNGFYDFARQLLANPEFQNDRDIQTAQLKRFRALIKKGRMPESMMAEIQDLHESFAAGTSLRCRSSTNNEDLPGFSGAGLYDSYTHKVDEGHLSKSIKQVYASLWNFRAFEEREFYRVDHFATAMGVLVHPSYKDEKANGVAVTDDILYQTTGNYYLNTQTGEDLVTNPDDESVPEEGLLDWFDTSKYQVMRSSNRAEADKPLLAENHMEQLRKHLARIHARFAKLYGKDPDAVDFAMEIEFKVSANDQLVIKQARPWVFAEPASSDTE